MTIAFHSCSSFLGSLLEANTLVNRVCAVFWASHFFVLQLFVANKELISTLCHSFRFIEMTKIDALFRKKIFENIVSTFRRMIYAF